MNPLDFFAPLEQCKQTVNTRSKTLLHYYVVRTNILANSGLITDLIHIEQRRRSLENVFSGHLEELKSNNQPLSTFLADKCDTPSCSSSKLCVYILHYFVRAVPKSSVDLRGTAKLVLILNGLPTPSNPFHVHIGVFSTGNAKIKKNPD